MACGTRAFLVVLAVLVAPSSALASGLPEVASGARPGPDALYAPPPTSVPQLENAAPWTAAPILVSGATAYRKGEFLYQDWLSDDRGAVGIRDPGDPFATDAFLFSPKTGTYTYPTDKAFANAAADLVELRVRPLADATAFRVTLNAMGDPGRVAFTLALGGTPGTLREWPYAAGVSSPADLFVTVHGAKAVVTDAASGAERAGAGATASVDARRMQIDVRVPHTAWDPGRGVARLAAGVGLWDVAAGEYQAVGSQASATAPGGGAPTVSDRLFNVAFRGEAVPNVGGTGAGVTIGDAAVGGALDGSWWRERHQATMLRDGDLSEAYADVDFGKLAAGTDDDGGVPRTGPLNRIVASRHVFGQGVDYGALCGGLLGSNPGCTGAWVGQLQSYALYVPARPAPARGYGLTLLLHSLSANYNQYTGSKNQRQLGERGAGSLVVTPQGRGPDGSYEDIAEADTFEVWADVARRYPVDAGWVDVSGYSMGGYGTFRLAARWPDLFARAFSVVGAGSPNATLASLRNVPLLSWAATADELVNVNTTETTLREMQRLKLPVDHWLFAPADHLTLATNDEYGPGAAFLGEYRVDRSPPHVTYVIDKPGDSARAQAIADHAYWLSGLTVRGGGRGTIDARSEAFGVGDPPYAGVTSGAGTLDGGSRGPLPYTRRTTTFGDAPATPKADRLVVRATNVASAVVDTARARLSCAPQLDVTSDGPLDLKLACPVVRPPCAGKVLRLRLPRVGGRRVVSVQIVRTNGRLVKAVRGRSLRVVRVRRPSSRAFTLRLRARTNGPRARTVTVVRRFAACA